MSAPRLAGGSVSVRASGSATKMTSAPAALALCDRCAVIGIDAERVGPGHDAGPPVWSSIVSPSIAMPSGSARVRTTSRICGCSAPASAIVVALLAMMAEGDADRFGHGRRFVEQRGGGDRQAGQFGDQRLEVEQHLQPALADLGLVGRVGRVPGRILEQVALDDRRHEAAVVAGADEALQHDVARPSSPPSSASASASLAGAGSVERPVEADRLRHRLRDQRLDRGHADGGQHGAGVGEVRADVAGGEA